MAADAIRGYLEALLKDGIPMPPERTCTDEARHVETIAVAIEGA
jgi:hypothetical protein